MENSKLWNLIISFSVTHIREAGRFIKSPYFNRKDYLINLWQYLEKAYQSNKEPVYEKAFRQTFIGEVYHLRKLILAMSDLYKLLLHFLAIKEIENEEEYISYLQVKALRKLGQEKFAKQNINAAKQVLERHQKLGSKPLQVNYELEMEQYIMEYSSKPADVSMLQQIADAADAALICAKLRQSCLAIAHQTVYPGDHHLGITEILLAYLKESELLKLADVAIYYHCFLMLGVHKKEVHFRKFKDLLLQHHASFDTNETRDLFLMGINYGIRKVNNGEERYFEDIMRLYEVSLEGDHLLENGLLSRFTYYNIVAVALRTERFDWGENFIYQYRSKLAKPYRESSFSFCKARLAYAKKEFDEALPLLQKANYKDPLLNLSAKTLLLKIYYELDEFDLLQAHLDAMQNYILRKKVIGYHKTNYLNTIRYTKRLLSLNYYDKVSIKKLRKKLDEEEILTEKRWMLSQLER